MADRPARGNLTIDQYYRVAAIHNSGYMLNMSLAGGGQTALTWLLAMAGASKVIYGAMIPYNKAYVREYYARRHYGIGIDKAVSERATVRMSRHLMEDGARQGIEVVGVAVSAATQTNYERRGTDHVWLSIYFPDQSYKTQHLDLTLGNPTREVQEQIISECLIHFLIKELGVTDLVSEGGAINPWLEGRLLE